MSDDKVKMTENERYAAARKRARQHICEMNELTAQYPSANEREELSQKHYREIEEILGDLDTPCVGSQGGPNT